MPAPVQEDSRPPLPAYDPHADEKPAARAALALVPAEATEVAVTDLDEARVQVGLPDLTSDSLVRDRVDFWERARQETVLLTEGRLRDQDSRLLIDHGFTSDDVDWEVSWTGPDGSGWALGFRPDLAMRRVQEAVDAGVGPLEGAEVSVADSIASVGTVDDPDEAWGAVEDVRDLAPEQPAESAYYRTGCVQLVDALGPDATTEDLEGVLARHPVERFEDLTAFSISFTDGKATARLGRERTDVVERADLTRGFPSSGGVAWGDAFGLGVNDPVSGRLGWNVTRPLVAARLVLTDVLPWAACPEVEPLEEPTGL